MLTVKDIRYGLIPFGPGSGMPALYIDIGSDDQKFDYKDSELFENIVFKIKEKELEQEWLNANNGTHSVFIIFKGGVIEEQEHHSEWDWFHRKFSKNSLDIQLALKLQPDKIKPQYCIWAGEPKEFTGNRQFYQYFNSIYAIIQEDFNQLATQEIINHQFSSICLIAKTGFENVLSELRSKYKINHKLVLVDYPTEKISKENIGGYCLNNRIRFSFNLSIYGNKFLELY